MVLRKRLIALAGLLLALNAIADSWEPESNPNQIFLPHGVQNSNELSRLREKRIQSYAPGFETGPIFRVNSKKLWRVAQQHAQFNTQEDKEKHFTLQLMDGLAVKVRITRAYVDTQRTITEDGEPLLEAYKTIQGWCADWPGYVVISIRDSSISGSVNLEDGSIAHLHGLTNDGLIYCRIVPPIQDEIRRRKAQYEREKKKGGDE